MRIATINVLNLGDNLIFLPVVQGIRKAFPQAEILAITNEMAMDLYDPACYRRIVMRKTSERHSPFWQRPFSAISFFSALRSFKPDVVLIAHAQPNMAHLAAWLSGARLRIGGSHEYLLQLPCLTHPVHLNQEKNMALQDWDLFLAFCKAEGLPSPASAPPRPNISHLLTDEANPSGHVVLHPGASQVYKRWPLDRFLGLAKVLARHHSVHLVLESETSAPSDSNPNLHFVTANNLPQLVQLLQGASLFVGNNSGPMHVAAALGVPSIIITGPSKHIWDPFWLTENSVILEDKNLPCIRCEPSPRPINRCINLENPLACMRRWTVPDIFALCEFIMAKREQPAL